jgi:hypothetical protein
MNPPTVSNVSEMTITHIGRASKAARTAKNRIANTATASSETKNDMAPPTAVNSLLGFISKFFILCLSLLAGTVPTLLMHQVWANNKV